jgi:hypothetical protein
VTKKFFFPYGSSSIKDGSEIRFSEDKWIGHAMLEKNIRLCTVLYVTKLIQSLRV